MVENYAESGEIYIIRCFSTLGGLHAIRLFRLFIHIFDV